MMFNNTYSKTIILIILLGLGLAVFVLSRPAFVQHNVNQEKIIPIYLDVGKIDSSFSNYIKENQFKTVRRLTMGMIDSDNDGTAELNLVKRFVNNYFPEKNDSGLFVIDWEGLAMKRLRAFSENSSQYPEQIQEYIKVMETIKAMRPNVKVGIYNIPFRISVTSRLTHNPYEYEHLFPLIKKSDFLSPSLYNLYTDAEVSKDKNEQYFKTNIAIALELGKKLNKPVIPYIGIRYYNRNSKHYNTLVSEKKFKRDMEYIFNTSFNGNHIDGFILWNGDRYSMEKKLEEENVKENEADKQVFLKKHFSTLKRYISILDSLRQINF